MNFPLSNPFFQLLRRKIFLNIIRIRNHCPKFKDTEWLSVSSNTFLRVNRRPFRI